VPRSAFRGCIRLDFRLAAGDFDRNAYVESAAGVSEGGRTGLANMVTGMLMLASLFLYPLSRMAGMD